MLLNNFHLVMSASIVTLLIIAWYLWRLFAPLKVRTNKQLLDDDRRAFLGQLDIAVRSHMMILPSLPVSDILNSSKFSRAAMLLDVKKNRRFDFVLYHRRKMEVCCVISLIDYNQKRSSREFKILRDLCEAANLPLLEYDMKPWRDVTELRRSILSTCRIETEETSDNGLTIPQKAYSEMEVSNKPTCSKCNGSMTLRKLKNGANAGSEYWVCTSYPKCKGVLPTKAQT